MRIIKKLFIFILSLCVFSAGSLAAFGNNYVYNEEDSEQIYACEKNNGYQADKNSSMCFSVLSDVHIMKNKTRQDKKFKEALDTLKQFAGGRLDAAAIAGDLADSGNKYEYRKLIKIYNEELGKDTVKVFAMGNHDFFGYGDTSLCQNQFKKETMQKLNDDKVVKGYHFITVSTEDSSMNGKFGRNTRAWLKEHLDKAVKEDSAKPVFVIAHQPIRDTIYGSNQFSTTELGKVISNYPQVIYFAGHSHRPLNDERMIYQKNFTVVGTGTIEDVGMEKTAANHDEIVKNNISQGLFVEVKGNKVSISRVDFLNKKIIGEKWVVENPADKTGYKYTDERKKNVSKPYFIMNSKINLVKKMKNTLKIQFNKAYNVDKFIERYNIKVADADTGKVIKSEYIFTNYFAQKQSSMLDVSLEKLKHNHLYTIVISAVGEFGTESDNNIEGTFKTA